MYNDVAYNFLRMAQCEYNIWSSIFCEPLLLIRRQQQQLYISYMKIVMIG